MAMSDQPTVKTCTKCGETKPLEEFHKHKGRSDGRATQCKACNLEQQRKYRERNREKLRDLNRNYYQRNRETLLERSKAYYEVNRDRIAEQKRDYYQDNKPRIREQQKEYRQANGPVIRRRSRRRYAENIEWHREYRRLNRDRRREQYRQWLEANRERVRQYRRENRHIGWKNLYKQRSLRRGFTPVIEDFTAEDVIARYGDHCAYCETGAFENLDHYVPVKDGGPHTLDNVRPSCFSCNRAKSDADPEEWLAEQAEFDALTEDEQNALIDAEIAKYLTEED